MVCTHRFKFRIHPHTPTDVSMYVPPHASWVGASASLEPRVTRSVTATRQSKSATDGHKPPSRRRRPRSVRVPNRRHPRRNASSFPSPTNVPPGLRVGASDWATNGGPPQRRPRLRVFCFRSRHGAVPASPPPNRE
jgi:hypothetical protein